MEWDRVSLEEWQRHQPLSVLQLDVADRAVLRVAGIVIKIVPLDDNLCHDSRVIDSRQQKQSTLGEYRLDFIDRSFVFLSDSENWRLTPLCIPGM